MKKEYDFSKGVKDKFYIADAEFDLPIYLEVAIDESMKKLAVKEIADANRQFLLKKTKNQ